MSYFETFLSSTAGLVPLCSTGQLKFPPEPVQDDVSRLAPC